MEMLKTHWIRIAYCFTSALIVLMALYKQDDIVSVTSALNNFSYVGIVITIVALIVSIAEVIHSVRYSKSISFEAEKVLKRAKTIEGAAAVSECLSTLNDAADFIDSQQYQLALKCYQHFRILFSKIPGTGDEFECIDKMLGDTEMAIRKTIPSSCVDPIEHTLRASIHRSLENIKQSLEKINPARGRLYVTH